MTQKLIPDQDFYYLPDGRMVLTETYLLKQGKCCNKGCFHCPYDGIETHESNPSEDLIQIQCPFCFENFGIPANAQDGITQQFVYDCEICCRPILIEIDFSGASPTVSAKIS